MNVFVMCSQLLIMASIIHHSYMLDDLILFSLILSNHERKALASSQPHFTNEYLMFEEIKQFFRSCTDHKGHNWIQAGPKLVSLPLVHGLLRQSPPALSKVQGVMWFGRYSLAPSKTHIKCYIYSIDKWKNTNTRHSWSWCWLHTHVLLWKFFEIYAYAVCTFLSICDSSINFTS